MPAAKIVSEFLGCAFDTPGFDLPVIPFDNARKVHYLTATNGIVKQTTLWTEPIHSDRAANVRRLANHRHQPATGHAPRERSGVSRIQARPHPGVKCVGPSPVH